MSPKSADSVRALDLEQAILEAARDLMAEGGIDALSMRVVAERVGVSATAIYHYFDNKDALVRRIVEHAFHRFGEYLAQAAAAYPRGSFERVRELGHAYVRFAIENQAYFRVLFSIQRQNPRTIADLPEGGGYELFRQAVVDAMAVGNMRVANPDLMVMYLWCVVHGLVTISLVCRLDHTADCTSQGVPASPEELFHAFQPFVREGVLAAGSGDGGAS